MNIRFLIISDTHGTAFPDPEELPYADILIHCGDLTQIGGMSEYKNTLEALSGCPAELKLVIPGNHDVSLDPVWWAKHLDEDDDREQPERAKELFASFASKGIRLLEEGTHKISLRDGRSLNVYASPYTPDFNGYAFAYSEEEDRFNTGAHPITPEVDVVITHGPPLVPVTGYRLDQGRDGEHCGCSKLWTAIERTRPSLHCFGHIHEGYGCQVVRLVDPNGVTVEDAPFTECDADTFSLPPPTQGTLLVNAAMMSHEGNNEESGPWVVDIVSEKDVINARTR